MQALLFSFCSLNTQSNIFCRRSLTIYTTKTRTIFLKFKHQIYKNLDFLFFSSSRNLILKSPVGKKVLLTVFLSQRIFFEKNSNKFKSPSGGMYTTLKIIFPVRLSSILIDKDSLFLQFMLKSLHKL